VEGAVLRSRKAARLTHLYGATALACLFSCAFPAVPVFAQDLTALAPEVQPGSQMLLEADTLVYDNDAQTVTAVGGVQIDYAGNRLVAQRVTYDRKTKRLVASGNAQLVNSDGTKVYSEHVDITDDFGNGFINALRVETPDKTYMAAESAERMGGVLTTFHNGVYTACEPCEDKPNKPALWRIKARKVIWNGEKKTIRFEQSNFEFFGFPIAYLPAFEIADPTVKRKSGFLIPGIRYKSELGVGVTVPYYFALSPTYDLTAKGTYYSKQGFLGEAEWRQRFNNGEYSLKMAGIHQNDPQAFDANTVDSGTAGDPTKFRGMMGTKGHFAINSRWDFGWDILAQTDKNFSYTYDIDGYKDYYHRSEVYLTGLNDRNYFDLRAMRFQVQESALDSSSSSVNRSQPWVLPSLDYAYIPETPLAGGQLSFNLNARAIHRDSLDKAFTLGSTDVQSIGGIEGDSGRITAEAEWKRTFITDGGLVITPMLAFQADANYVNASTGSIAAVNSMANNPLIDTTVDTRSTFSRFMATAGLELRYPILFAMGNSSHILEPMVQTFARPNEQYVGGLGIPNEDAQSFVFDATTLFERDKFSGYDRIEGGTRANIGLRYSGSYDNGWSTHAVFGQSYALAGHNSFDTPDLANVGAYSGLETDTSDFVGLAGIASPSGFSASVGGRFDEKTFEARRTEVRAAYSGLPVSLATSYTFIQAQPLYGFENDRHEASLSGTFKLDQNWSVFGSGTYNIEDHYMASKGAGFSYADECFTYLMTFSETLASKTAKPSQSIGFNISFRTIGDFGSGSATMAQ
jgi:LPS-assembly protein